MPAVTVGRPRVKLAPNNPGTIAVASAVMFAAAIYPAVRGGQRPSGAQVWKRVWAIMLLTLVLAAADDFVPEITGPFALSLIVAVVVLSGWFGGKPAAPPGSKKNPVQTTPHQ